MQKKPCSILYNSTMSAEFLMKIFMTVNFFSRICSTCKLNSWGNCLQKKNVLVIEINFWNSGLIRSINQNQKKLHSEFSSPLPCRNHHLTGWDIFFFFRLTCAKYSINRGALKMVFCKKSFQYECNSLFSCPLLCHQN